VGPKISTWEESAVEGRGKNIPIALPSDAWARGQRAPKRYGQHDMAKRKSKKGAGTKKGPINITSLKRKDEVRGRHFRRKP